MNDFPARRNVKNLLFLVSIVVIGSMNSGCILPYVKNEKDRVGTRIAPRSVAFVEKEAVTRSMVIENLGSPGIAYEDERIDAYYWTEISSGVALKMAYLVNPLVPIGLLSFCEDGGELFFNSLLCDDAYFGGGEVLGHISKRKVTYRLYLVEYDHQERVIRAGFERLVLERRSMDQLEAFVREWGLSTPGHSDATPPVKE